VPGLANARLTPSSLRDHTLTSRRYGDAGVEVRNVFHQRRSHAIEPFNGVDKHVVERRARMPVKGLRRLQLLALGAVALYQLVLLYQHEHSLPLGKSIKPLLRAA
jgi:hypothetical protein